VLYGGDSAEREVSLTSGIHVAAALAEAGCSVRAIDPAQLDLRDVDWRDFDVAYIALHGGAGEDGRVQSLLAALGVPFTGATSGFYEPTRETMKRVCRRLGIDTPAHVMARGPADVERAATTLSFPLFVKHPSSYASIDLSRASRVVTPAGLRRQARKIMRRHGAALIEEYIDGVECTVLVAENPDDPEHPTTYAPVQYRFPEGEHFKHADLKWVDYEGMAAFPVEDPALEARLRDICSRFFVGLGGTSFGRCDLRVDAAGRPFLLEINANCGVYYRPADAGGADLCLLSDPAGHEGFTRQIVAAALARHGRSGRSGRSGKR
ncbi:MAG: hypothetical protein ACC662_05955, partial [Planctomycetota bacterium]